ncbi:chromodomain-helicase-DNA-binding protein 6 isoform X1 [Denticeps clupeoides]|uniref:chromodomain-helicase-DNA-binding protein 6 isoform X1 n=1 Tax=Denticeps clupeoides TaxID=299321 RepID=UPI0010A2CA42|nr:chromodomain-helicase-DNA-binding protein 6 isoform X1 [Denticeps clupeoides]XP_028853261.1 chromodomain-helicase-DNA-binding protein 6 isoform X1 [Denticeps clupeoides]XP_028853264.1 chromodomain-helicase-DNA-binding protein 6 isoform X1 [Denticeps clupeoides]
MKIQKKDKQMCAAHLLKHSPSSAVNTATDQNAQTTFHVGPLGKEQIRIIGGQTNHCMAHTKHSGAWEVGPASTSLSSCPRSPGNSEEDDGGGGTRVKKKRKKKDRKELSAWQMSERESESKPKKKKEVKEGKELLPRKSKAAKEPRKTRELTAPKESKKGRKPKNKALGDCKAVSSLPRQRGRKPKEHGAVPPEKKKKGKRKSEALPDGGESDDTTSLTTVGAEGEESSDPLDSAKRRSGRQVKRRKYNEDLDFKVVDDDGETIAVLGTGRISALSSSTLAWQAEEPPEDEANIIEKILSVRPVKRETDPGDQPEELEEFYVKYRNFSYLHCKWATLEELEKDPRIHQKIKRFRNKQAQMKHIFTEPDEDLFNPDYIEVDRLLEVAYTTDTETGEEVTHYLVKWCSLSYEESTWELQEDVDPGKIREFEDLKKILEVKHVERPLSDHWQKLEKSREYRNANQLREYQLEGMNWLLFNWYNRKNCILADEMGLGKTIQSITFLYEIFSMGIRGPFLIIAPLSTITNWEREFRTWTEINVIVYHGSQISRQMILQYEMYHRDEQGNIITGLFKFHGVITTFEMVMADCPELKKIHWRCVVIDEAHRLKNRNCKLLEGLKLMNLEHKVLLTGTPLQNSVEELFSLLNFLEPLQFPSESTFLEEFGDLKTEEQVKKLQAILKPMMLRRLKDDVEKNLAPKEETIIEVELTNIQKKYYRAILEKNFTFLAKGANQHNMPNLINTMMELRKCCNHPYLITGAEEKILESFRKSHNPDAYDFQLQAMIQGAGKLVLIDKLLPKLLAGGHKVLIFSQMVRCLDILEDYLIQKRYTYERIDGRVRGNLRQAAIDRFCKVDSDRFVFLLCTRAGGLGINLTAADTCIIFDSDWNPQNDLQAQARCHRIGQSKAVKVYRLITRNSYEREMFDKASLKLGLDKAVLQDINRKGGLNGVQQLSKMEVEDLLRKGAYGALMDEEDEGSKFCEEDIDQILQRRTQTITIQSEGKGSTFAKASFVSSGNRTDISLDDPNFWQKWAKIAELEIDSKAEKESLVIDTPRVRKQTRHYNSFEDDELMEFSELDSDSEDRPCRTRRLSDRNRRYMRAECFRVEKNLLIFGWGRWKDILTHGRFKWHLSERDMELLCRALLVYCVRHYKGDDKIKSFIWELITPSKDGHSQTLQNHSGLSAPVPRGRKGKKLKNQLSQPELKNADWLVHCNPEVVLQDDSYKKHLKQHCNKVLLRVRMLYYLKVEVLGEAAAQALEDIPASKLEVALPDIDYIEIPTCWWDAEADKSLLIGVHKHGYERYSAMRADPSLCFLERVGMPDVTELSAEQTGSEVVTDTTEAVCKSSELKEETENKPEQCEEKDEPKDGASSFTDTSDKQVKTVSSDLVQETVEPGKAHWPAGPALTARVRRLVTAYQRYTRREPLRHDFLLPEGAGPLSWQLGEEFRRCTVEADSLFLEWQRRWTRREQADFYRTVTSFGVVYDPEKKIFDWTQFRSLARLERKTDESLERYFYSFVSMCRTACRLPPRKDEGPVDHSLLVDPITEERAARTLYRIELLRKVREQVLRHPLLGPRLQLCQPSLYLPVWWECGKHDRDLLIGIAKHGLSRTDFYILNDPQLSFLEAHRNYVHKENHGYAVPGMPHHHCCLYEASLGHCHSPQSSEYHAPPPHHGHPHIHPHMHHPTDVVSADPASTLAMSAGSREGFLDCPPLEESLELASLQHDGLASDSLHGKPSKEAFNGFPFNSASGGQSMLNSYGEQSELNGGQGDMDSIAGKLRSDVLVGEQGSSEETGLMTPSVELDELQTPWESSDHATATDMFNEADPILGPTTLESEFLDSGDAPDEGQVDASLNDCLSMPSSDSQSNPVDPLPSSFMLFKELSVAEPSVEQTDLSASPPEYVPPPLSLPDISLHHTSPTDEPEEKLSDSDVTHSVPSPVDGAESVSFEFEKEDLSRDSHSLVGTSQGPEESSLGPSEDTSEETTEEPGSVPPREHSVENLREPCEVPLEESNDVQLVDPHLSEPCDGSLQEPCEDPSEEATPSDHSDVHCEGHSESAVGSTLSDPTLSSVEPSPSSPSLVPSLPLPLPDAPVSPQPSTVFHIKQEFLQEPALSVVKPDPEALEPDSTTLTPTLEQTDVLEVKDELKEERVKTPALMMDSFVEVPRFAPPMSVCEMADSLHDVREPTIAQLLQEKALYSFSEWPKDRVIINRIDSVCHAILKGKWPSSSQQYDSPGTLGNACVPNTTHQRLGFMTARVQPTQSLNFSMAATVSGIHKERLVTPPFLPELKRPAGRRGFDFEPEVLSKPCHSGEKIQVGVSHRGGSLLLNGWQEAAIDLSKPGELMIGGEPGRVGHLTHAVHSAAHKLAPLGSMQSSLGLNMADILQAGLIHPVTGQIVNGTLRRDDAFMRRRRGRRRNVDGPDLGFIRSRGLHVPEQQPMLDNISHSAVSSTTATPQPECLSAPPVPPSPSGTPATPGPSATPGPPAPPLPEALGLEREAANKGLMEWLRQNPNYSMEISPFATSQNAAILHSFVERPKQRRHRCKDPTKLDINSLTGEERVPVVHRGTGRRLGGAMAPAIKELSRWLDANSEYCVAPDWAEVVKHSGFLPEGKFTRILTEPVNRDPGPRRRGRRPRSEMVKTGPILQESSSSMGPLFMNGGLIGSMDLVSLQNLRNVPGIPLTGLMGFPHGFAAVSAGEDGKNGLSMLPMMLHGMAAVQPPMFAVSGLMSQAPSSSSTSSSSSTPTLSTSAASTTVTSTSATPSPASGSSPAPCPTADSTGNPTASEKRKDDKGFVEGKVSGPARDQGLATPTTLPPSSITGNISTTGSHLTFNPFLIPGMPQGLLYPHMFLPHGSIMALPGMAPADISSSPKRKKKKMRDEHGGSSGSPQVDDTATKGPSDTPLVDRDGVTPSEEGPQSQEFDSKNLSPEVSTKNSEEKQEEPDEGWMNERLPDNEEKNEEEEGSTKGEDSQ